ncbi:aspartate carbamoyltransferase regulatory subunit [Celerinatantimonas diazotrophica]|uniref:Aspartate carbamoyltransferase regulatory chain n=1 Tax=Celerinatantimonas diazotrophica TaxID=412034 RepID=A0A4V2PSI8_9GAMM|nr:aspartate carbamoyltransferase regulatory subunit [Celerinatantimonas diazotrophica]TCK62761.1 aspartate carbamoyltransferase regulatory subunit [Celerinatantimonas diazotrophica]CAG9298391.1 Aspartate carbamoyltransferase regulatory chain [Celerinatantimonas diazotrophica]
MEKKLQVEAIEHGTVIDHIPAGQGIKILRFLQLADANRRLTIGLNLPTHNDQAKDLIKVAETILTAEQANQLALFAPTATINVIENYTVVDKFQVTQPKSIRGVFQCPNSNCITHTEMVPSHFLVQASNTDQVKLKCHYCEKSFATSLFNELKNG